MRLTHLRPVFEADGPFATVYLRTNRATATAAHEIDVRLRHVSEQLAQAGAPAEAAEAISQAVNESAQMTTQLNGSGPEERVLVWAGGALRFDAALPDTGTDEFACWEPVPRLMPYVRAYSMTVPHVVAVVNRAGGDLMAFDALGRICEVESVDGSTFHLRKVKVGDWAHLRYLHHTEERWKANAKDVATAIDRLVEEVAAERLVVAGDVRAREKLRDELNTRSASVMAEIDSGGRGGESAGIDEEAFDNAVNDEVTETARHSLEERYAIYEQRLGKGGAAAEGLADVVAAAGQSQLDTLFIGEDFDADHPAWIGSDAIQVALTRDELKRLGVDLALQVPVGSALLRAAVCTDAEAHFVPNELPTATGEAGMRDNIGALLRY